jgi:hypothetical protein
MMKRAYPMANDHKHGEMDTSVQEATFNGFMTLVARTTVAIIITLILLALIGG